MEATTLEYCRRLHVLYAMTRLICIRRVGAFPVESSIIIEAGEAETP